MMSSEEIEKFFSLSLEEIEKSFIMSLKEEPDCLLLLYRSPVSQSFRLRSRWGPWSPCPWLRTLRAARAPCTGRGRSTRWGRRDPGARVLREHPGLPEGLSLHLDRLSRRTPCLALLGVLGLLGPLSLLEQWGLSLLGRPGHLWVLFAR